LLENLLKVEKKSLKIVSLEKNFRLDLLANEDSNSGSMFLE
jgi:hypothetical protein